MILLLKNLQLNRSNPVITTLHATTGQNQLLKEKLPNPVSVMRELYVNEALKKYSVQL
jgi:hypothetical protein